MFHRFAAPGTGENRNEVFKNFSQRPAASCSSAQSSSCQVLPGDAVTRTKMAETAVSESATAQQLRIGRYVQKLRRSFPVAVLVRRRVCRAAAVTFRRPWKWQMLRCCNPMWMIRQECSSCRIGWYVHKPPRSIAVAVLVRRIEC